MTLLINLGNFGSNNVMCALHVSGYRSGKTAYGHQQPCRTVLPTRIRTAGKDERADNDGHGEGIYMQDEMIVRVHF